MAEEQAGSTETIPSTTSEPVKKNRVWKWVKRIFWTLTIFILFILISAGCILYFFGDKIKEYAIGQLNTYLTTPVYIDPKNIDFTVLKNFPNASVDFKDVKAMEVSEKEKKDILFHAGSISFQFNVMDIFRENYDIKKVSISDVDLNLKVDKNGKDNYHFLKESADTSSSKFEFALQEFTVKDVRVNYVDRKNKIDLSAVVKNGGLEGAFNTDNYSLQTTAELFVGHLKSDSSDYLPGKNITLDLAMNVDNKNKLYTFTEGDVKIEDLFLAITGNVVHSDKDDKMDLSVKGKEMDIQSVLSLVPARYKEKIKRYESDGDFYFSASIKGMLSATDVPVITSSFGIKKGEISQGGSDMKLMNVNLSGNYFSGDKKNKKSSFLDMKEFSCALGGGSISGNFKLDDLDNPTITAKANAGIGLNELQQFLRIDTIEKISGDLKLNASFHGKIKEAKKYISTDFKNAETAGEMSINGMNMKLKNNELDLNNINGSFSFRDNDLGINSFTGNISNTDFDLKGVFKNILGYLFLDKEDLMVNASLHSKNIDLNELLSDKQSNSNGPEYKVRFPEYVDMNLNTIIDKMEFRKFEATNISGGMRLKDKRLVADPIAFRTMDGRVTTSVMVDATHEDKLLITCDASLDHLNVSKVFTEFENFGQDYLQDKHLRGVATATVQFASVWSPSLEIDPDKVYALCDITIERGELVSFSPFIEIADDLKKDFILNKLIEVDEFRKKMEHIKFQTLTDQVEIKKQKIEFSPTVIKSSAMNIGLSGWHKFNDSIDYKVSFLLAEVLTKGEKKRIEQNAEFGVEEKDENGKVLYYEMYNTVDKPLYKKDYKTQKEKRKEERKKEKQNLKQILHDEFNWMFKKDSTLTDDKDKGNKNKDPKKDENKFIIKWDDDEKDKKKEDEDY